MNEKWLIKNADGKLIGEVRETELGYVPRLLVSLGNAWSIGPEFPFRTSAVEWINARAGK